MNERRYAVLIGNSSFPQEPKLSPLRCPGNDVDGLQELLRSKTYGRFTDTVSLKEASSNQALVKIQEVFNIAESDDLVLIYYSGHGKQDLEGHLYLATSDTQVSLLTVTSIAVETISTIIRNSRVHKIILILDCCYSGAISRAFLRSGVDSELQRISPTRGTYILTASTSLQATVELEGDQYGLLTKHIIEGIKSGEAGRADGVVTMDTLYKYVYQQISQQGPQEPVKYELNVRGSELIICRTGKLTREEWGKRIRKKINELDDQLPPRIQSMAIKVISRQSHQLSSKQGAFNQLLDEFLKDTLTIPKFIDEWEAVEEKFERIFELSDLAQRAMDDGDYAGAVGHWEALLKLKPDHRDALSKTHHAQLMLQGRTAAQRAMDEQDWQGAIDHWKVLLKLDPEYKEASTGLREAQGKLEESIDRINTIYVAAQSATDREDWNTAIGSWQALFKLDPDNKEVASKLQHAERMWRELLDEIKTIYEDAQRATEKQDWITAINCWRALLKLDPDHKEAANKLQHAQIKKQEALDQIKTIYQAAQSATQKDDWVTAIDRWQALIELDPDHKEAINNLRHAEVKRQELLDQIETMHRDAQSATHKKDWITAINRWQALLKLDPNHKEAALQLQHAEIKRQEILDQIKTTYKAAQTATQRKDWITAINCWQTLIRLDPDRKEAVNELQQARRMHQELVARIEDIRQVAQNAKENEDWIAANEHYKALLELDPNDPDTIANLKQVRLRLTKKCPQCDSVYPSQYSFCELDGASLVSTSPLRGYLLRARQRLGRLAQKLKVLPSWFLGTAICLLVISVFLVSFAVWSSTKHYLNTETSAVDVLVSGSNSGTTPKSFPLYNFDFNTFAVDSAGRPTTDQIKGSAQAFSLDLGDGVSLEMVYVPAGKFRIGSGLLERFQDVTEKPQEEIAINSFYLGKYEVTRGQWLAVAKNKPQVQDWLRTDPSQVTADNLAAEDLKKLPVDSVTWFEAKEFARRLSTTRILCRLPSEAEWEYACRAGTSTPYAVPDSLIEQHINYDGTVDFDAVLSNAEQKGKTLPVGYFEWANQFGLFDMHGNVWEWCEDRWYPNYNDMPKDGQPRLAGGARDRVIRGGGWGSPLSRTRSAARWFQNPETGEILKKDGTRGGSSIGVRIACDVK